METIIMKVTKKYIRQIISEELNKVLSESPRPRAPYQSTMAGKSRAVGGSASSQPYVAPSGMMDTAMAKVKEIMQSGENNLGRAIQLAIFSINKEENPQAEVALGEYIDDNYPGGQSGFIKDIDEEIAGSSQDPRSGLGKYAAGYLKKNNPSININ